MRLLPANLNHRSGVSSSGVKVAPTDPDGQQRLARVTVRCLVQPAPDVVCVCHAGIQIIASLDAIPVVFGYTYTVTDNAGNTAVIIPRARVTALHQKHRQIAK